MAQSQSIDTDVLIIGGGAIGICSAHYLTQQGRKVTVVEKGEICSGSSYGNAGLVVPSHCVPLAAPGVITKALKWMLQPESPFYVKPRLDLGLLAWLFRFGAACTEKRMRAGMPIIRDLSLASVQLFEELAALDGIDFGYEQKGMLMAFNTEAGLAEGVEEANLLREIDIEADILNPAQLRDLEPGFRDDIAGAVFYPQDAHFIPDRFVRELARHAEEKGADLRPSTEVLDFEVSDSNIVKVKTTRGDFSAAEVVLAAGAWSPQIAGELFVKLPIQAAKGYSVTFKRPPLSPEVPCVLAESKVAVTPMGDTLRFGGTLELAGLDLTISKRRVAAILKAAPKYFAELNPKDLELIEIWRGLRPCTPDGLPFLGRSSVYRNLVVAAGHAMVGMSLAPVTGKLVSELVAKESPSIDLSPLRVERFSR